MITWQVALWYSMVVVGLGGSALYSGLESGAYSLNRVRLQILAHQRLGSAVLLQRMLRSPAVLLGTLLLGNNIANYMGTAGLTVILQGRGYSDWQIVAVNVVVVTPVLLVFGETLPKDLFSTYSDRLMYRFAWFLDMSRQVFTWTGLLPAVRALTSRFTRLLGREGPLPALHPRRHVEALVREGVGYGLLSEDQSAMVERVLELSSRNVRGEMIPWPRVVTVQSNDNANQVWELAERNSHARLPMVDTRGRVTGVLDVQDVLVHDRDDCPPLKDLAAPPVSIQESTPLWKAISILRSRQAAMAMVTRGGQTIGLVTMKDLVEPITGELVSW